MDEVSFQQAAPILERNGVEYAGVFGSRARGTHRPESDVDILVRFRSTPGLFRFLGLKDELSSQLGISVDLVTEDGLSPHIRDAVLRDLRTVYERR
jgi:predicted nucleotidyltransferase